MSILPARFANFEWDISPSSNRAKLESQGSKLQIDSEEASPNW
jgi:hypothetical protein